jgi:hypothetical protein
MGLSGDGASVIGYAQKGMTVDATPLLTLGHRSEAAGVDQLRALLRQPEDGRDVAAAWAQGPSWARTR